MKILVTGANGMLGQDLCPILEDEGHEVIETDIHNLDITNEQEVIEKNKFGREISKFQPVFEEKLRDQMSGLMGIIARTVKSISESGEARYELHISNSDDEFGGSRLPIKSM